jgi:hypothetical protein
MALKTLPFETGLPEETPGSCNQYKTAERHKILVERPKILAPRSSNLRYIM